MPSLADHVNDRRVRAFLDVLAYCEGTGNNYNIIYSGRRFSSFAAHPHIRICAGKYCSDAAGRYQFLGSTWDGLRRQYGFADFSPRNQDMGAVALLIQCGALSRILSNDFAGAVRAANRIWPSLPGGSQQTRNWEQVAQAYAGAVGSPVNTPVVFPTVLPRSPISTIPTTDASRPGVLMIAGVFLVVLLLT
jgi:muramidase (phage lysozyme)